MMERYTVSASDGETIWMLHARAKHQMEALGEFTRIFPEARGDVIILNLDNPGPKVDTASVAVLSKYWQPGHSKNAKLW